MTPLTWAALAYIAPMPLVALLAKFAVYEARRESEATPSIRGASILFMVSWPVLALFVGMIYALNIAQNVWRFVNPKPPTGDQEQRQRPQHLNQPTTPDLQSPEE